MADTYTVKSKVQKLVKGINMWISSKAIIIIDGRIEEILKKAAKRAQGNKRRTIMPQDI